MVMNILPAEAGSACACTRTRALSIRPVTIVALPLYRRRLSPSPLNHPTVLYLTNAHGIRKGTALQAPLLFSSMHYI